MSEYLEFKAIARYTEKQFGAWYLELEDGAHAQLNLAPNARVVMRLGEEEIHRALRRSVNGYDYVGLSIVMVKKMEIQENAEVTIALKADTSEYGMDFPEEMQEVMDQDPEGKDFFERANPGIQRGFLHYVSSAKGIDTRIKRALHVMNRMRELNAEGKIK